MLIKDVATPFIGGIISLMDRTMPLKNAYDTPEKERDRVSRYIARLL